MPFDAKSTRTLDLDKRTVSLIKPNLSTGVVDGVDGTRPEPTFREVQVLRQNNNTPSAPPARNFSQSFRVLRNWEGVVTTVQKKTFHAEMRDTEDTRTNATDQFEIELDNVSAGDQELVTPGAVFYLTLGVINPPGEGPQKTTRLVFRRMPRWSRSDVEQAEKDTDALHQKLHAIFRKQYPDAIVGDLIGNEEKTGH